MILLAIWLMYFLITFCSQIAYAGFTYGPALSETQRHLVAGVHTINIGGTPVILPQSTLLQGINFNFCGHAFLVVKINYSMYDYICHVVVDSRYLTTSVMLL